VITHTNAFAADLEAVHHAGAQPVLVDVEADGLGPDADAVAARHHAPDQSHLGGPPLWFAAAARRHRGDFQAAQSGAHRGLLARARGEPQRAPVGAVGRAGCFSCGVVKNLGAYGDAAS